jgi:hypothetical protein
MDPNVSLEQLALQMQIYALNNSLGGLVPDSTLSVVDAIPGTTIQSLDVPTDEQGIQWETWHSRVDSEYAFEPESSTPLSAASWLRKLWTAPS